MDEHESAGTLCSLSSLATLFYPDNITKKYMIYDVIRKLLYTMYLIKKKRQKK